MKPILFVLTNLLILTACGDKNIDEINKDYIITIETSFGDMKVILYDETPVHKKNFLELARSGRYDGTIFHRVMNEFMIQGGDVYQKEGKVEPKEDWIPSEIIEGFFHRKGELAAARYGDEANPERKSSSCQFYIVQGKVYTEQELTIDKVALNRGIQAMIQKEEYRDLYNQFLELSRTGDNEKMDELALQYKDECEQVMGVEIDKEISKEMLDAYTTVGGVPHLDALYTVFGRVVEGLDVIDKIAAVRTQRDRPIEPIQMTMTVDEVSKKSITKKYGYKYPGSK